MTAKMISASARYFEALNQIDREGFLACFGDDAELHDPYGGRPFVGHEALGKWFTGMERTWQSFHMRPVEQFAAGDRLAVRWTTEATAHSGKTARFDGINIFTINESGQISRLEGYWDAAGMMAQIA